MGKRIIQRARGGGGPRYRARKKAFFFRLTYPQKSGEGKVLRLISTSAHTAPIAKISLGKEIFYNVAVEGITEGQKIFAGEGEVRPGNILQLKDIPVGIEICNIETVPFEGPKLVRASGLSAKISKKIPSGVVVLLPSKKEKLFDEKARATVGVVAASGRVEKPIIKAGKMFYIMQARGGRVWPRTSAVKVNIVDHPFGGGRGKRIKAKIAKFGAPPGAKVGLLRPRRTGRRKR